MKKTHNSSINVRFVTTLALCTIFPMLICSFFFQRYEHARTYKEYIDRSKISMMISSENIEHYIKTSVSSVKNIYIDSKVISLLSTSSPQDFLSRDSEGPQNVFSFMQSIYNVAPDAVQMRLVSNRLNKSFLLITNTLQKSLMSVGVSEMKLPEFTNPTDVYLEPTHEITSYGHTVYYSSQQTRDMQVFTIWLPIFKLDASKELLGTLAIDMPISLIETNCQTAYSTPESIFVVDETGSIIAGSISQTAGSDISNDKLMQFISDAPSGFSYTRDGNDLYLQTGFKSHDIPWKIIKVTSNDFIYKDINNQMQFLLTIFFTSVCFATILNSVSVLHFTSPLRKATAYMKDVKRSSEGTRLQLSDYVAYNKNDELKILFDSLQEMIDSIENHTIREYKLELMNQNTLLKMLQAQINPHFVYNTLQCLATNALKDHNVNQYDYISALGQMMHYAMDLSRTLSSIREEEEYVTNYFNLQKMRFDSESEIMFHNAIQEEFRIPKMTLQPLIENSIYHGNILNKACGWIRVTCTPAAAGILIQVIDNGAPILPETQALLHQKLLDIRIWFMGRSNAAVPFKQPPKEIALTENVLESELHIGIENVYKRLLLNFGSDSSIELFSNEFGGTTVEIRL